jgi:predicted MFS family arabinose efflux permease
VSSASQRESHWAAIVLLAASTFIFVTGELLPVGLLSAMSRDLEVSVGAIGLLVTAYAGIVVAGAVPLTALSSRAPRKGLLLALLAVQVTGSAVAALAPSYAVLLGARVLGALAHGVFWSIIAALAARLAGAGAGRATAAVFTGNSIAVVLGVPAATLIGQRAGWRTSFAALALIGALLLVATARVVPRLAAEGRNNLRALPAVLASRPLRAAVAITGLLVTAQFTVYTYITPLLERTTGLSASLISPLLLVFGVTGLIGNLIAGRLADRNSRRAVNAVALGMLAVLATLSVVAEHPVVTVALLALWGLPAAAMSVVLQTRVLDVAGASPDAASAVYVAIYNLGIGGGALLGAQLIPHTGPAGLPLVGATFAALALVTGLSTTAAAAPAALVAADPPS